MNTRYLLSVSAAAIAGCLVGGIFVRQTPVKAQSEMKVYTADAYLPGGPYASISGTQVVGFSCVEENLEGMVHTHCYIAYLK